MRNNDTGKPVSDAELARDFSSSPVKYNLFLKQDLSDINPISAGMTRSSVSDKKTGIHTTDCANLYYIISGRGTLFLNDRFIPVKEGDFFVVPLGARAALQPAPGTPLPHRWIGFTGTLMHDFEQFPVPFTLPEDIVEKLCDPEQGERNLGSRLAADLFLIHSIMQQPEENEPDYVQKVINLINATYMQKLSVSQMARDFGLDRCHLSRLFKAKMNMSIQDYILQLRLGKAKRYLKHGYSTVDVAILCGFGDRANFSKLFTREIGCSPTEWKKIIDLQAWNKPR